MSSPPDPVLDYAFALLRTPFEITEVKRRRFPPGGLIADQVVTTNRYLFVAAGALDYEVEAVTTRLQAGAQLFVPHWVRRRWRAVGADGCELCWCSFATVRLDSSPATLFWREAVSPGLEQAFFQRQLQILAAADPPSPPAALTAAQRLGLEGELKGSLGRFWPGAHAASPAALACVGEREDLHPEMRRARRWLDQHFRRADALEAFYREPGLSPGHFRKLFRATFGCTVQDYLGRLRLRRARHLVHETQAPLKQIAAEVGYADPLFFSRQYARFWGHPPSEDRPRQPLTVPGRSGLASEPERIPGRGRLNQTQTAPSAP